MFKLKKACLLFMSMSLLSNICISSELSDLVLQKISGIEIDEESLDVDLLKERDRIINLIKNTKPAKKSKAVLFGQDSKEAKANQKGDGSVDYMHVTNGYSGLTSTLSSGAGDLNIKETLTAAKDKVVSIGMQMTGGKSDVISNFADELKKLKEAQKAEQIEKGIKEDDIKTDTLLKFLFEIANDDTESGDRKNVATSLIGLSELLIEEDNLETRIELRPGYEVDGTWNGYTPETLKKAFRLVSDLFLDKKEGLGLNNTELVFQLAAYPVRQSNSNYDIYNGETPSAAAVTKHIKLWDPNLDSKGVKLKKSYYQQIGMSIFRTDAASKLWQRELDISNSMDPEGVIGNIRKTIWNPIAKYAKDNKKSLQISELSPQGAFGDTEHWNTLVEKHQENVIPKTNVFTLEKKTSDAVPLLRPTQSQHADIQTFYDLDVKDVDPTKNAALKKSDEVYNTWVFDAGSFLAANSSNISSVNMITYNWEEYKDWEAIAEYPGATIGSGNQGAWGNGWRQDWIDAIKSAAGGTAPTKRKVTPFTGKELQAPTEEPETTPEA